MNPPSMRIAQQHLQSGTKSKHACRETYRTSHCSSASRCWDRLLEKSSQRDASVNRGPSRSGLARSSSSQFLRRQRVECGPASAPPEKKILSLRAHCGESSAKNGAATGYFSRHRWRAPVGGPLLRFLLLSSCDPTTAADHHPAAPAGHHHRPTTFVHHHLPPLPPPCSPGQAAAAGAPRHVTDSPSPQVDER